MKISIIALQLIAGANVSFAFSPAPPRGLITQRCNTRIFSQWEDEEEEITIERKSFSEAGEGLKQEEDDAKMGATGDYDANPAYNSSDIERVKEAIRQRTEALGIEKSKVSIEAIQAAQERAKAGVANQGESFQSLDLSQISQEAPRGEDNSMPAMLYDPAAEMTEEEMIEADPDGQLSFQDQVAKEISSATWPTPLAAFKEVGLLIAVVVLTASLIIGWDNFLRETYTNLGFIPKPEDIMKGSENMVLPDGWTNGMSEDDFMNFQDEVGKEGSKSPSVSAIKNGYPEL